MIFQDVAFSSAFAFLFFCLLSLVGVVGSVDVEPVNEAYTITPLDRAFNDWFRSITEGYGGSVNQVRRRFCFFAFLILFCFAPFFYFPAVVEPQKCCVRFCLWFFPSTTHSVSPMGLAYLQSSLFIRLRFEQPRAWDGAYTR